MITKHNYKTLTWIDMESPSQDEIRDIAKEYRLNPLVVHELSAPTLKPKVDLYENFIYLILHFPHFRKGERPEQDQEIDFIVGKKFLITVRYSGSETLHFFAKMFETSATLNRGIGPHAGFIFIQMISKLYESLIHELAIIRESLNQIENKTFKGEERKMVIAISEVSRELLSFKRSLSLHRDILESFEDVGRKIFGDEFKFHLRTLTGDYYRVEHSMQSNAEFLNELRETNNSLLSTKQNEVMQTLTILAFIALPATTVLSLFQIETVSRPIVGIRFDFWILLVIVGIIAFSLFFWFKHKKWL